MTTVLIATQPDELRSMVTWGRCFAASRGEEFVLCLPQRRKGETRFADVPAEATDDDSELVRAARRILNANDGEETDDADAVPQAGSEETDDSNSPLDSNDQAVVESPEREQTAATDDHTNANLDAVLTNQTTRMVTLIGADWKAGLSERLKELNPKLVIAPAPDISRDPQETDWRADLPGQLDCEVMLLRDDAVAFKASPRVAVFLSPKSDDDTSLNYTQKLTDTFSGTRTAVFVEPNVGDFAAIVGRRQLDQFLRRFLRRDDVDTFQRQVFVGTHRADVFGHLNVDDFDLLIISTTDQQTMKRFFRASPVGAQTENIPAVAVVRPGASLGSRLWSRLDRRLRSFVPQLSREDRVRLVGRIQESSQWDFDFILLISLATLIACLGLAENSVAVIVGAMLVAPLMTPIAGVGLGVAHANSFLTKIALRTALRGFATAVVIGVLFGFAVQIAAWFGWQAPLLDAAGMFADQIEGRTRPQFYDLLIALASGFAAAYAMGRPNLSGAIPGVAIAAALVPPIATSGIAFSHGEFLKGGGALLLFVTNMIVIILGTALVFRAVGIRSQKEGPTAARWPRYALLLLVVLSFLVTIVIELFARSRETSLP